MGWNSKYWDIIDRYYWSPGALGLKSIPQKKWVRKDGMVCVPMTDVNRFGPLYSRQGNSRITRATLGRREEVLNDLFDLTFAIAPDTAIRQLLFEPVGIDDPGPFESFGREIAQRYGWGDENVTQQDGFFVSERSLLGVEVKLKATSSPDQLVKYLALMVMEELQSHVRQNIGLLFILASNNEGKLWRQLGLGGPEMDREFLSRATPAVRNRYVRKLLDEYPDEFRSAARRLRLAQTTWTRMGDTIGQILARLDQRDAGQQTLYRLLLGFRQQLDLHADTGITRDEGPAQQDTKPTLRDLLSAEDPRAIIPVPPRGQRRRRPRPQV
jgi:hypothetical protein